MSRTTAFAPNEWYHCFNRGVDKRRVYMDRKDYQRFQSLLYASNSRSSIQISALRDRADAFVLGDVFQQAREEPLVDIGAYALMPNHYHLLIREREEGGITSFMRRLSTAYTMYFNERHDRTGSLFSGRFKALHVDKDEYLKRVVNYIHGNPAEVFEPGIKAGRVINAQQLRRNISNYEFASLYDYESPERPETSILSRESIEELLDQSPSTKGVLEDFQTFYSTSNKRLWL